MRLTSIIVSCLLCGASAQAALLTYDFVGLNRAVPDNDAAGVTDVRTPAATGTPEGDLVITDVNVHVTLSGWSAINGDLYVYVQHGAAVAVLLNRVGRRAGDDCGYGDPGFDVTFDDEAVNGDIHGYRATLFGNHDTPLGGPLTDLLCGSWAPDARRDDPSAVTLENIAFRDAELSNFDGERLGGTWSLFVADMDTGGQVTLDEWSLTFAAIPEPIAWPISIGVAFAALVVDRVTRRSRLPRSSDRHSPRAQEATIRRLKQASKRCG
ncbi:MAG: proprotein convertase P-domain-containing protein [Verrucomicrobia bacterium]|nr:proprotein convertase P-domain-containing protein [Verrucomicrobiota bacterium]